MCPGDTDSLPLFSRRASLRQVHDGALVEVTDLSSQFYLSPADVGNKTRSQASTPKLAELNPYVKVSEAGGDFDFNDDDALKQFSAVVLTGKSGGLRVRRHPACSLLIRASSTRSRRPSLRHQGHQARRSRLLVLPRQQH